MNQRVPPVCHSPPHQPLPVPPWQGVTPRGGKSQLPSEALAKHNWGFPAWPSGPRNEPPAARSARVPLTPALTEKLIMPSLSALRGRLGWLSELEAPAAQGPPSHFGSRATSPHLKDPQKCLCSPLFSPFPLLLPKGVWGLCSALLPSSGWALTWRVKSGPATQTPDRESTAPTFVSRQTRKKGTQPYTFYSRTTKRKNILFLLK